MLNFSAKPSIRKDYIKSDGQTSIFIQIIIGKRKTRIPIHLTCKPSQFVYGKVLAVDGMSKTKAHDYNMIINKEMAKANDICIISRLNETELTIDKFKDAFATYDTLLCFIQFCNDFKKKKKGLVSESTIESYRQTIMHLTEMQSTIYFNDLTIDFVEDFEKYMKKRKMKLSTRGKHHKNTKMFITRAIRKGIKINHPYKEFTVKTSTAVRTYLNESEINKMYELWQSESLSEHLQYTLTAFLFSAKFGGIRLSDMYHLEHDNIVEDTLVFYPQKTSNIDKLIKVPLTTNYKEFILTPYGKLFRLVSSQKINKHLKVIADLLGIKKSVSFHVARHSFGTNFTESGGGLASLKTIMGHSKLETTMIYVHMSNSKKAREDMIKLNGHSMVDRSTLIRSIR